MALAQLGFFSSLLGKQMGATLILPDRGEGPFACLYLLHGLSDDHTIWLRRTRIEVYAGGYPLVVVMPDGLRGFYTDHESGPAYGRYIAEEVPGVVERHFRVSGERGHRCIGGLSMGGYGALRTALAYPERYISAHSHSGAFITQMPRSSVLRPEEQEAIFGQKRGQAPHDVACLAREVFKGPGPYPKLRFDCGRDDHQLESNRLLHAQLDSAGVPHEYEEHAGAHTWDYWDLHIRSALAWHAQAMGLGPQGSA